MGGTGKFLRSLLTAAKTDHITYIDLSQQMINLSERYINKHIPEKREQVTFICGSIEAIPTDDQYDLIVTNYFLDVFNKEELEEVFNKLHAHFTSKGIWYYTDFTLDKEQLKGFRNFFLSVDYSCTI